MKRFILANIVMVITVLCCISCASRIPVAPSDVKAVALDKNIVNTIMVDYSDENDLYSVEDTGLYVTYVDQVYVITSKTSGMAEHMANVVRQRYKNLELIQNAYRGTEVTGVSADDIISDNLITTVRVDSNDIYDLYPIYLNDGKYEAVVDSVLISTPEKNGYTTEVDKIIAQRKAHLALIKAVNSANSTDKVPEPPSVVSATEINAKK